MYCVIVGSVVLEKSYYIRWTNFSSIGVWAKLLYYYCRFVPSVVIQMTYLDVLKFLFVCVLGELLIFSPGKYKQQTARMLAINVSIPNLTVARLKHFRPPQLQNQRERPTNVGV